MSGHLFDFMGRGIPFRPGESVAAALDAAGITILGRDGFDVEARYFCGIGACQSCLTLIDGVAREACLTPARAGMKVESLGAHHD